MKSRQSLASPVPTSRRCAIYTRKSTAVGLAEDFNSLDAQREACAAYVARQPGWKVIDHHYDDGGFTGANTDRPAFQRLLADVEAGQIDIVLVYKVDRLGRSLFDFVQVMTHLEEANVSFVSVTQNFSTADYMGRFTLNMLMLFAELEREMIRDRTRDKIAGARRRGKWTGGVVPLGYSLVEGKLVANELEAVVVQEIFDLYLEHRAVLEVVRMLNERHRATKRHRASNGHVREGRAWTKPDVYRILKNPLFAGYITTGNERHEGAHSPLVSREVFGRVQAQLASAASPRRGRQTNPEYLLRGVLRCACCGAMFTPASTTTAKGTVHRYYRCGTRDKQGKEACRSSPLPAGAIENYVMEHVRTATADGALAAEVSAVAKQRVDARRGALCIERNALPVEIGALSNEIREVLELLPNAEAAMRPLLQERMAKLGTQLARAEAQLAVAERAWTRLHDVTVETDWVARCLTDFDRVWGVLSPANRARLVRAVISRVEVDEPANTVTITIADLSADLTNPADVRTRAPEATSNVGASS